MSGGLCGVIKFGARGNAVESQHVRPGTRMRLGGGMGLSSDYPDLIPLVSRDSRILGRVLDADIKACR